jgi:hypothetical protein
MRFRHLILLCSLALAGCGRADYRCDAPETKAAFVQLERSVGAQFADEYFTLFRRSLNSCQAQLDRAVYINEFFYGFRTPYAGPITPLTRGMRELDAGMRAGQKYRLEHPTAEVATYASFGYTAITIKGEWITSFDTSLFIPTQGYDGEEWHLETLFRANLSNLRKTEWGEGQDVEVRGYVSGLKATRYSGRNYDRQLFAQDVRGLGGA